MPVFVSSLLGGLLLVLGSVVGRVMVALGLGYASYTGLSVLLGWMKTQVQTDMGSLSEVSLGVLATLKVDVGISILFSAIGVRLLLLGLSSDVVKRIIVK